MPKLNVNEHYFWLVSFSTTVAQETCRILQEFRWIKTIAVREDIPRMAAMIVNSTQFQPRPSHASCNKLTECRNGVKSPTSFIARVMTSDGGPAPPRISITKKRTSPNPCAALELGRTAPSNTPTEAKLRALIKNARKTNNGSRGRLT